MIMKKIYVFFIWLLFPSLFQCYSYHKLEPYGYRYVSFDTISVSKEQRKGIGIDNSPYLNDAEVSFLNALYNVHNEDSLSFDFSGKKVAFLEDCWVLKGKKEYFEKYFRMSDELGRPILSGIVIFRLSKKKSKKIEGYDVVVSWYDKPPYLYFYSSKNHYRSIRRCIKQQKKQVK